MKGLEYMTVTAKYCHESRVVHTHTVLPSDTNPHHNLFGGQLMEFVNDCGYMTFIRHTKRKGITASMDNLNFLEPIPMGNVIRIETIVSGTGDQSVEVFGKVIGKDVLKGTTYLAATAFMTFVTTDEDATEVFDIVPETEEEQFVASNYETRRKERLDILQADRDFHHRLFKGDTE